MKDYEKFKQLVLQGATLYMPQLSLDCVIFGFHEGQLKVLLLKMRNLQEWALPGGFIYRQEALEVAASRILKERTGLDNIFLQQFHIFSDPTRSDTSKAIHHFSFADLSIDSSHWLAQRFISVGFYALVDFTRVTPQADELTDTCQWYDLENIPPLMMDHRHILDKALETLRIQLNYQPIGMSLMPEQFTMPELQKLYETILGVTLDRRNFQRKILGYHILKRREVRRTGVAHKSPYLYSFDEKQYQQALQDGLHKW
ncbi:NUDIX hydrolase [Chitinophaga costaii]|nr:NUDIX domain-containing protein [Chitinophaga costaii]PUZ27189.1 NUDIX hydrolase [Chitinophaga costaii]